jgi:hypothetical protein
MAISAVPLQRPRRPSGRRRHTTSTLTTIVHRGFFGGER